MGAAPSNPPLTIEAEHNDGMQINCQDCNERLGAETPIHVNVVVRKFEQGATGGKLRYNINGICQQHVARQTCLRCTVHLPVRIGAQRQRHKCAASRTIPMQY